MVDQRRKLLVVDDEAEDIEYKFKALETRGWQVNMESDANSALRRINEVSPDAVMLDLHFDEDVNYRGEATTGWVLQKEILSLYPNIAVVLFTKTYDDEQYTFENQPSAHDIYRKNRMNELFNKTNGGELFADDLSNVLNNAIIKATSSSKPRDYKELLGFVVGKTSRMMRLAEYITKIAATDVVTVLIEGENGTGKGLAAKAIHNNSTRGNKPFMVVDCTTIPKDLLESTLFGQRRGAFTNAIDRDGLFKKADTGTIFLDEIGEMPLELQVKLLRFVQEKKFLPIGGQEETVDVRIIAATNRNLANAAKSGNFREDLYYRLSQTSFTMLPLRERREDIPELCETLLPKLCLELKKDNKVLRREAYTKLCDPLNSWSGNIRDLENVLRESVIRSNMEFIFAGDVILPQDRENEIIKNINPTTPSSSPATLSGDVDMIRYYLDRVETMSSSERYDYVKEIPKNMLEGFFSALVEMLKQQLQKKVENKDIAKYLCGMSDQKTCSTVRQFLTKNGCYLRGPVRPNE